MEKIRPHLPYIAAGAALALFLFLVFRPLTPKSEPDSPAPLPQAPAEPAGPEPQAVPITLDPGTPIFTAPGTGGFYTVTLAGGSYPCLEQRDGWARLESPAGWVDLTAMAARAGAPAVISFADSDLLTAGGYLDPLTGDRSQPIVVRANRLLTDLQVYALSPEDPLHETGLLLDLVSLAPGDPLVLRLDFSDFRARYGLCFTTEDGTLHRRLLAVSLASTALEIGEY